MRRAIEELMPWLLEAIGERAGLPSGQIDPKQPFSRYGFDSAAVIALAAQLGEWLGRDVAPILFWRHPTAAALAHALTEAPPDAARAPSAAPARAASAEPVAIVGMACRMPGADDLGAFWDMLRGGRHGVREVPPDRWDAAALAAAGPGPEVPRRAGFLGRVDGFDALFFGMSPREAVEVDPQQRLILELAWEALEDAGCPPPSRRGTRTGVFVGAIWHDYARLAGSSVERVTCHTATGQALNMVANRLSYALGLQGPSLVVDTACSSSLVAAHLACQSLWSGESELAVVGGVSLMLSPHTMLALTRFGGLSADGLCKAFDARADGFGRGEGGGVVVLQPLSRAIADGARIYAVIRGTATNNDGPSNGLTAPNPEAQEELLRQAYARAGVPPTSPAYVEAHGTGTSLGDPIEASALGAVLGAGRGEADALRIGSVKTNVGHLEGAAGVAGLIKAALCVYHRQIAPSLHFERPNPHIPFADLGLRVPTSLEPWPASARPARAGVSSFGWGGTNAHVVLEEPPHRPIAYVEIAALDEAERESMARQAIVALADAPDARWTRSRSWSAEGARFRLAAAAPSGEELRRALTGFLAGERPAGLHAARVPAARPRLAFVFSPQGGQYPGNGCAAMATEPAFRGMLAAVDELWAPLAGWSLRDAMREAGGAARLDEVDVAQPIIFAIQIALAEYWRAAGVVPDAVVGHSLGEIAGAVVAGILDLEQAVHVVYHYSRLQARIAGRGAMLVAERSAAELARLVEAGEGRLAVAAHNGPRSTVLSGEPAAVERALAALKAEKAVCAAVRVNIAAHSPQVDEIEAELVEALSGIRGRPAQRTMISTARGEELAGPEVDGRYFAENLRRPVLLAEAVGRLLEAGHAALVELGPNPVLLPALRQSIAAHGGAAQAFGSLAKGEDERADLYETRAALFCRGFGAAEAARPHILPLSAASEAGLRRLAGDTAALLGARHDGELADLCHTAAQRRAHHPHRLAAVAGSWAELTDALAEFADQGQHQAVIAPGRAARGAAPVAFVFPGQGSQWLGMGQELLREEPAFRRALEDCDAAVRELVGWSVIDELGAGEASSQLARIDVVQPVLFSIEVALAALWRSWGIEPDLVIGHSMGEIAAAHVAGVLSLPDAARVICLRSRLLRSRSGQGAMLVCELTLSQAAALIAGVEDQVSVAVSNSSRSTVLSGDPAALARLGASLDEKKVFWRWVKVDVASHSPQMDPLRADLLAALDGLRPGPARVPMQSTVTDELAGGPEMGPAYWVRNLRDPVLFASAVRKARARGIEAFVELSPHPILLPAIEQELADTKSGGAALASTRRNAPERAALLRSLGALYGLGRAPRWPAVQGQRGGRHVSLPAYPWQREVHWLEPAPAAEAPPSAAAAPAGRSMPWSAHPLLGEGTQLATSAGTHVWSAEWAGQVAELFRDHVVQGEVVTPAAAFAEMMLAAGAQALGRLDLGLRSVALERALVLPPNRRRRVQTVLVPGERDGEHLVEIFAREAGTWQRHARAVLAPRSDAAPIAPAAHELGAAGSSMDGSAYYAWLEERGLEYGAGFRGIEHVAQSGDQVIARFSLPPGAGVDGRLVCDPRFVDVALQASAASLLLGAAGGEPWKGGVISVAMESFEIRGMSTDPCESHVQVRARDAGGLLVDVTVTDEECRCLLRATGMKLLLTPARANAGSSQRRGGAAALAAELAALDDAERPVRFEAVLRECAGQVLRLAADRVPRDVPLRELGMDSILSLELRNRLEARCGLELSATLLWNHPTVAALAATLLEQLAVDERQPPAAPREPVRAAAAAASAPSGAEPLDEAGAARLLADELAQIERLIQEVPS